jgi:hypothetical protein
MKVKRKRRDEPVGTIRLMGKRSLRRAQLQQAERKSASKPSTDPSRA